jgi:hypothetical protein
MLLWPFHAHSSTEIKAVFPLPTAVKGTVKLAEKREVATAIFRPVQSGITVKLEMMCAIATPLPWEKGRGEGERKR